MAAADRTASQRCAPFPWEAALAFGFGRLRLSSATFWALTPRELGLLLAGMAPVAVGLDRVTLEGLMARWPDSPSA